MVLFDQVKDRRYKKVTGKLRFGVGLAWSPSQNYSIALKLNKRNESQFGQGKVFGREAMNWHPGNDMEFILSYGDHLVVVH